MENTEHNQIIIHPQQPIQKASEHDIPSVKNTTEKKMYSPVKTYSM
jgi:hypothetical protein